MRAKGTLLAVGIGFIAFVTYAQQTIPRGTIIPVSLNSFLFSQKTKPGQAISARVMQDVPLPNKIKIKEGARITGHVIEVKPATRGAAGQISFIFDQVVVSKKALPVTMTLRAVASPTEVESAQIPTRGMGEGDSWESRTTVQVGGDVVYWGGGPVENSTGEVGRPVSGTTGVLVKITAKPGSPCEGDIDENQGPQALWVFSSDACGIYGLPDAAIIHAGRTQPSGVIELGTKHGDVKIRNGSGMLLRVIGRQEYP